MPKRIPSEVIKTWGKLKHDLLKAVTTPTKEEKKEKLKAITKQDVKEITKTIESLYAEFDLGLSAKLKKGSTTKSDAEAVDQITKAKAIATTYLSAVKKKKAEWGFMGPELALLFEKALNNIIVACDAALA